MGTCWNEGGLAELLWMIWLLLYIGG